VDRKDSPKSARKPFVSQRTMNHEGVRSCPADEMSKGRDLPRKQVPRANYCLRLIQNRTMIVKIVEV
jgi:hypothetical protein